MELRYCNEVDRSLELVLVDVCYTLIRGYQPIQDQETQD
jgi:hypothetical protein